jgi:hypothetical protein
MRPAQINWDSTCLRYSTPFADDWMSAEKKGGRSGILPSFSPKRSESICDYIPEVEALAAVLPDAFGTLR